jgi:hypothetical protein
MSIKTAEDVKTAETKELVATYNNLANANIKKFTDRKTAERRVLELISGGKMQEPVKIKKPSKVGGKRESFENRVIQIIVKENPKRPTSRAHKKFEILMNHDGKTVGEYKKQEGRFPTLDGEKGWPATEIRWALALGLVKITNA